MLLSRPEIRAALEAGEIIIDPFDERNLGTASYDVTLGSHFYRERGSQNTMQIGDREVLCPTSFESTPYADVPEKWYPIQDPLWTRGALTTSDTRPAYRSWPPSEGIDMRDEIIWLAPQELILAHTVEFIGSTRGRGGIGITTQMHSRSTTVRMGLDVCGSGGWGDHGFCNRWTMEIRNNLRFHHVPLIVGRRVAQISFFRTEPIEEGADYTSRGKYCTGSVEEMKRDWKPEMMLPRAYKDREVEDTSYQKTFSS